LTRTVRSLIVALPFVRFISGFSGSAAAGVCVFQSPDHTRARGYFSSIFLGFGDFEDFISIPIPRGEAQFQSKLSPNHLV
jgi:hypothetical protein